MHARKSDIAANHIFIRHPYQLARRSTHRIAKTTHPQLSHERILNESERNIRETSHQDTRIKDTHTEAARC